MADNNLLDKPVVIGPDFQRQLEAALKEPTLTHAMVYLCICETDRIVQRCVNPLPGSRPSSYETCFAYILTSVREEWIKAGKPLDDFQPSKDSDHDTRQTH